MKDGGKMGPVSMQTLELLSDELAQWWTVEEIHSLFESAGIPLGPAGSDGDDARRKRPVVRQYLGSLNLDDPGVVVRLSWVLDEVLAQVHGRLLRSQDLYALWVASLRQDGLAVDMARGRLTHPPRC